MWRARLSIILRTGRHQQRVAEAQFACLRFSIKLNHHRDFDRTRRAKGLVRLDKELLRAIQCAEGHRGICAVSSNQLFDVATGWAFQRGVLFGSLTASGGGAHEPNYESERKPRPRRELQHDPILSLISQMPGAERRVADFYTKIPLEPPISG